MTIFKAKRFVLGALAALAVANAPAANATSISTLFNTGVGANGVATTGNGADLHWTLDVVIDNVSLGGTAYTGYTNGPGYPYPDWVSDTSTSRWITSTPSAGDTVDDYNNEYYVYSTSFSLVGTDASTASFSGLFAADDSANAIILNGDILATNVGTYGMFTSFSSAGGTFNSGENTLTFITNNNGGGAAGLNVDFTQSAAQSAVPEPATWAMMLMGFGMIGLAVRSRRRQSVNATYA